MQIQFLYYEDCPSHDDALERLRGLLREEAVKAEIEIIKVETEEEAQEWKFVGSPTILIDGEDIVPVPADADYHLSCRVYQLEDGRFSPLPSREMIRKGILAGGRGESSK